LIDPTTTGNVIAGNLIGTNASGAAGLSNAEDGIDIWQGAHDNTVGPGNVISGNGGDGILLGVDVSGTAIFGNFIGTNAAGTAALGNSGDGILFDWAPDNIIGGEAQVGATSSRASSRVLISGAVAGDSVVAQLHRHRCHRRDLGSSSNGVVRRAREATSSAVRRLAAQHHSGAGTVCISSVRHDEQRSMVTISAPIPAPPV
jgi:hypothetical protein